MQSKPNRFIPYGRHQVDEDDIAAVVDVLRSDWLTTGPKVAAFERAFADFVGAGQGTAVNSGTAALHAAVYAAGIGEGDEVIVPAITFAATANVVVHQGGRPVFADVHPDTLLISPADAERRITPRTKAIIPVDYAGQPCDYDALRDIASRHDLTLISDACHSLGAEYKGRKAGTIGDLTVFSFHPVKHVTTGEGGMGVTDSPEFTEKMRRFRNHGINADHHQRGENLTWQYEITDIGYNYRISDIQCALGLSQLKGLPARISRRREIAARYDEAFAKLPGVSPLACSPDVFHVYHLYVIRLDLSALKVSRERIFSNLRHAGIGVNVHYLPVYLHPFYRDRFGYQRGECPAAEAAYEEILSLPIFPGMGDEDVAEVVRVVSGNL